MRRLLRPGPGLRALFSLGVLALVFTFVDLPAVAARLADLHPGWLLAAFGLSVIQTIASAWRWRFTARRLGIRLPLRRAVSEYYLAGFLNQVVPGGVVGDVSRALRHAVDESGRERNGEAEDEKAGRAWTGIHGGPGPGRRAVHAVVLERLSGQLVVVAAALLSGVVLMTPVGGGAATTTAALGILLLSGVVLRRGRGDSSGPVTRDPTFLESLRLAVLGPRAFPVQFLTSLAVVGSYVATYLMAARAIGVETPVWVLLPLVTPVLLAMLIPVSVAGWGVREGAAAALWSSVGLTGADGVAISVAYGVIVLLGTLPGVWVLIRGGLNRSPSTPPGDRGRRAGLGPAEGAVRRDGAPRSASRPAAE